MYLRWLEPLFPRTPSFYELYLVFGLREGFRTVIQLISTLVTLLSQFYCIFALIHYGGGLGVLSWTNAKSNWRIHTHMSTPTQSTSHMCSLIIVGVLPFIECVQLGWLGALEVDLVHFLLDLVHLMPPWDSKPPRFPHPRMPRCNHWPTSSQPHSVSNSWLFRLIWGVIGLPMGV